MNEHDFKFDNDFEESLSNTRQERCDNCHFTELVMSTKTEKCPTCGADAVNRSEYWEAYPKTGKLYEIEKAIRRYHLALDRNEHGGVAASKAIERIQGILLMHWERGQATKWLDDNPRLAKFYQ